MSDEKITSYSELRKELVPHFPDAEKVELKSVLNKEIVIRDFKEMPSTISAGKEYVVILAEDNGKRVFFNTGEVVLKMLKEVKEHLPIRTKITIEKNKKYYTLV